MHLKDVGTTQYAIQATLVFKCDNNIIENLVGSRISRISFFAKNGLGMT
jgi:hypothetical protein